MDRRTALVDMLLTEVRQDCICRMFDNGPHRKSCSTRDRAINLADDILLALSPGTMASDACELRLKLQSGGVSDDTPSTESAQAVRAALDDSLTPSLGLAEWACDPLPSCPHYAHVNPDWLRALIAEAKRVRAALDVLTSPGVNDGE